MTESFQIRPLNKNDKKRVTELLKEWWTRPQIITRGKVHQADTYPGFIAEMRENGPANSPRTVGLVTYRLDGKVCEITSLNSLAENRGIGTALVEAVKAKAKAAGCQRLWLITTNDNTKALRFWQRRGFTIAAVRVNALEASRKLKPEIPLTGNDGIPLRDEIELEMILED